MAVEVEAEAKLKALRTDHGGEFKSNEFKAFCEAHGIQLYLTAPYSPQQNGVVERRNQTVVTMAHSMMKSKGMPGRFWGEAVSMVFYLLNRAPTKSVDGMTPYEAWYGRKPSVDHLRTFGCVTHVKTVVGHLSKLADRSTPMVMIGYEAGTKAYRAYNPVNKKLVVTHDVLFKEEKSWNWKSVEPIKPISDKIFHVILYADDQDAETRVAADTDVQSCRQVQKLYRRTEPVHVRSADENAGAGARGSPARAGSATPCMPCLPGEQFTRACTSTGENAPACGGQLREQSGSSAPSGGLSLG
jgi:hypothetical protein